MTVLVTGASGVVGSPSSTASASAAWTSASGPDHQQETTSFREFAEVYRDVWA